MEVTPLFDLKSSLWVVEVDEVETCAKSLRDLQLKIPGATIRDYFPDGFAATRDGFLEASTRVPFVATLSMARRRQQKINLHLNRDPPPVVAKKDPPSLRDLVMNLVAAGWRTRGIAKEVGVSFSEVQVVRIQAFREGDPRCKAWNVKPVVKKKVVAKKFLRHEWTEQEDADLRRLAREGWSSNQIASHFDFGTRNSIIGRAHRLGIVFHGGLR